MRRHFAIALSPTKDGFRVERAVEFPSRGEADKHALTLLGRHGDAEAVTVEREIAEGDVLTAEELGR